MEATGRTLCMEMARQLGIADPGAGSTNDHRALQLALDVATLEETTTDEVLEALGAFDASRFESRLRETIAAVPDPWARHAAEIPLNRTDEGWSGAIAEAMAHVVTARHGRCIGRREHAIHVLGVIRDLRLPD